VCVLMVRSTLGCFGKSFSIVEYRVITNTDKKLFFNFVMHMMCGMLCNPALIKCV